MVVIEEKEPQQKVISSSKKAEEAVSTTRNSTDEPSVPDSGNEMIETPSVSRDVSEGFETASEGSENDDDEGRQEEQVSPEEESRKIDSYEDALDDDQLKQKALAQANDAKVEGNVLFKDGQYEDAILKYESALQLAPEMPSSVELRSICHANFAVCHLKLGKYDETVKESTKALELNPSYVKALVRRGEAYKKLEKYEEAIADMKKILELDPSNDQARRNIVRLEPLAREKMEKMKEEMIRNHL